MIRLKSLCSKGLISTGTWPLLWEWDHGVSEKLFLSDLWERQRDREAETVRRGWNWQVHQDVGVVDIERDDCRVGASVKTDDWLQPSLEPGADSGLRCSIQKSDDK